MSYSFTVRSNSKEGAKVDVQAQLAQVVETSPEHRADAAIGSSTADAAIDLLKEDTNKDVVVQVNGTLGWITPGEFTNVHVSASAYMAERLPVASMGGDTSTAEQPA
jgi:hypothetical protein